MSFQIGSSFGLLLLTNYSKTLETSFRLIHRDVHRVHFVVRVQRRSGNERFAADLALVRPLARVISFVNN